MQSDGVLGVRIDPCESDGLLNAITESVRKQRKDVFAYANTHALNLAWTMPEFRAFLNSAHTVYCDGEGVRLAARLLGYRIPRRIALTYFFWDICRDAERMGYSLFLLGSREEHLRDAVERIHARHPGLRIAGTHHGYFAKSGEESEAIVRTIQTANPDILFVGFGMPLQEDWIRANKEQLAAQAILPCGSMIEYASGRKALAPAWMSTHGLEWVYRLFQEPGRLWKRYLLGNPLFIYRVLRQRWSGRH